MMISSQYNHTLYTIGYTAYGLVDFLKRIVEFGISAVVDVRSSPFSRFYSDFNQDVLKACLNDKGIYYVPMGDELGARQSADSVYVGGLASYHLIAKLPTFQHGLSRITTGLKEYTIALLCAEKDPMTCHRSILICRQLRTCCSIVHIWPHKNNRLSVNLESHEHLELRLLKKFGRDHLDMLKSSAQLLDEAYDMQGSEIAYRIDNDALDEEQME